MNLERHKTSKIIQASGQVFHNSIMEKLTKNFFALEIDETSH